VRAIVDRPPGVRVYVHEAPLTAVDREALQRAEVIARRDDPTRARQLDEKLERGEAPSEVAAFAAHVCQIRALHLRPWQRSPAMREPDDDGPGGRVLRRLLAKGLSRYEPDPLAALAPAISPGS
jgi:hypothetical protein